MLPTPARPTNELGLLPGLCTTTPESHSDSNDSLSCSLTQMLALSLHQLGGADQDEDDGGLGWP